MKPVFMKVFSKYFVTKFSQGLQSYNCKTINFAITYNLNIQMEGISVNDCLVFPLSLYTDLEWVVCYN